MKLALIALLPLLDSSLDAATVTWLIGAVVAAVVLLAAGLLVTAPARRARAVPESPTPVPVPTTPPALDTAPAAQPAAPSVTSASAPMSASAPDSEVPTPASVEAAPLLAIPQETEPVAAAPEVIAPAPIESSVDLAAPTAEPPQEPTTAPTRDEYPATELTTSNEAFPAFAPQSSQTAIPIPVGPDFSASGPIILPTSMVAATFGTATEATPSGSAPLPPATSAAASDGSVSAPSAFLAGPLMPAEPPATPAAEAPTPEPPASAVPFVVTRASAPVPAIMEPAPAASSLLPTNGAVHVERVAEPAAVDLFARSYGRTNAAMLSATERSAAGRIARALGDDPLAVQLAGLYAAETHHSLDGLAQLLETDRRGRLATSAAPRAVSTTDALDLFAASYGRTNAAMLSATERSAAARVVSVLGGDSLAVRLAGLYAASTRSPLDRLANRLEADLRATGTGSGSTRKEASALATTPQNS